MRTTWSNPPTHIYCFGNQFHWQQKSWRLNAEIQSSKRRTMLNWVLHNHSFSYNNCKPKLEAVNIQGFLLQGQNTLQGKWHCYFEWANGQPGPSCKVYKVMCFIKKKKEKVPIAKKQVPIISHNLNHRDMLKKITS